MPLQPEQRLDLLKVEMSLIQGTLDKYDDLIFRNRNWFITLWAASIGLGFSLKSDVLPTLSVLLAILYWFLEGTIRHQYWLKYVVRYRTIRDALNREDIDLDSLSVYDLTNDHGPQLYQYTPVARFSISYLRLEPSIVYLSMATAALVLREVIQDLSG